jgi:hypothetical protein
MAQRVVFPRFFRVYGVLAGKLRGMMAWIQPSLSLKEKA